MKFTMGGESSARGTYREVEAKAQGRISIPISIILESIALLGTCYFMLKGIMLIGI